MQIVLIILQCYENDDYFYYPYHFGDTWQSFETDMFNLVNAKVLDLMF